MPRNKKFEGDMTEVGHMRTPPFVRLPDISTLFAERSKRFDELAPTSPVKDYVDFMSEFTAAQQFTCNEFADVDIAGQDQVKAQAFEMPPINRQAIISTPIFDDIAATFFNVLARAKLKGSPLITLEDTRARRLEWQDWAANIIAHQLPQENLAQHIYVTGALQIILTLAAAKLDAKKLKPIEGNLCPCCGGSHSASMIVGWPSSEGIRFCSCLYCGSLWRYVRIKCTFCEQTAGISFREIDGGPGTILAETCDTCKRYCKQLNQQKDSHFDVFSDDIGSLALDLLMQEDGKFKRGAFNPFLAGY
ncbi:formate dehydrogenase accessory protein FdhE [uncultured Bartonella sp.]|uniref:formate dehydrogenase accessory protein FdhE n=1 Tax=uncultured Bartonella sp. TaxID=104108 RepID=UPI0026062DD4|nr:formate dehydrogenase accessory protein FdhE [uncultured Bartonella sp.]